MKKYPGKWYRVEQRGCTPDGAGCKHLDWPIERCDVSPKKTVTRHVVPKNVLHYALQYKAWGYDTFRSQIGSGWVAEGSKSSRSLRVQVTGATQREALQNLCNELKVELP